MIDTIKAMLNDRKDRSTWDRAVTAYALELLENLEWYYDNNGDEFEFYTDVRHVRDICLNGADNWFHYSWGGCSLCYNCDIDERLNPPSRRGHTSGNRLLDDQARALQQAFNRLMKCIRRIRFEAEEVA